MVKKLDYTVKQQFSHAIIVIIHTYINFILMYTAYVLDYYAIIFTQGVSNTHYVLFKVMELH